jgi:excisionase family DNA binding protein
MKDPRPVMSLDDARNLPALCGVSDASALTGYSQHYITDCLARGAIKGVKFGRKWRIDTAALLRQFGIGE